MTRNALDQICLTSHSPEFTRGLGETIGRNLHARTVIGLTGDLGSGKTVLIQGIARGLGVPEEYAVTSPTYTFINEYPGRLRLMHVDLYRISDSAELMDIGFDDIFDEKNVVAIEWADRIAPDELDLDMDIRIRVMDDVSREFKIFFYGHEHKTLIGKLSYKSTKNQEK